MKQDAKSLSQRDNAGRQLLQRPATINRMGKLRNTRPYIGMREEAPDAR